MTASRARGQHAGLTAGAITDAAIGLADREGLAALSMRRIGGELGVEAMALYHHFPSKDALFDGMITRLATAEPVRRFGAADWREGLRDYAVSRRRTLAAHPNLVPLLFARPATTESNHRLMETLLESLREAGFEPLRALDMVYALNGLILVHAALDSGAGGAPRPHGESGQYQRLARVSAEEFPLLARAARAGAERGPEERFAFALAALLAGFGAD